MKILQVSNFFKPSWEGGGPPRVVYDISKKLVARGHEVTVYTTSGFKFELDVIKNKPINVEGITTYYFKNFSRQLAKKVFVTPFFAPIIIRRELKNFDIIHIHEFSLLGFFAFYYAKKYRIPYIFEAHGSIPGWRSKKNFLGYIYCKLIEWPLLYEATKCVALNQSELEDYKILNIDDSKIMIIPNGIDLQSLENPPKKGEFKKKFQINSSDKIILYIGRLHKSKGLDLLLIAFSKTIKEIDNVKLIFVGPDEGYKNILLEMSKELNLIDKIFFIGYVSDQEKFAAFVDADIFVTPKYSGFPLTFIEACACGLPIITTKNGNELDWIDNIVGYVIDYDDTILKDKIIAILTNTVLLQSFRENCKTVVLKNFDWDILIVKIEQMYEEVITNSNTQLIK